MKPDKIPAEKYIHRPTPVELVSLIVRIPRELKDDISKRSEFYGTSINRYVEAALKWYANELDFNDK